MSLLNQLLLNKLKLKSTKTKITFVDGSQEQIDISKVDDISIKLESKAYGFVIDTKPDPVPACILEFLYLGSQDSVLKSNIRRYQFTDILSVGIKIPTLGNDDNEPIATHFVECLDLPETKLDLIIKQTNKIIRSVYDKNGRVLVHCNAGVSRSSAVCIGYLMLELRSTFDSAYSLVKSKRACIAPNSGFLKQLKEMDQMKH